MVFSCNNISFVRSGNQILQDVNWNIKRGENWVLLGPNGIGKSTLISMMAARLFPTSGEVQVLGEKLGKVDIFKLQPRIGLVSADLGDRFPAAQTALEIVLSAQTALSGLWGDDRDYGLFTAAAKEKAAHLLDKFGVLYLLDRPWGVMSQGERKRVSIARALMNDPELLILDEPTAGLDLGAREFVIITLNEIAARSDCSVILVNHNVEEIPTAFDKIAIMGPIRKRQTDAIDSNAGTILYQGDIRKTLTSENISKSYGMYLQVRREANLRWFATASVKLSD